VGDSCHSATRPDLRIGDSFNSHLRRKKSSFIFICKALYRINTTDKQRHSLSHPTDMAATTVFREALNQGISSGNLADIEIILYSHRDSSGRVCRPKALYANRRILNTVPYIKNRESATLDTALAEHRRRLQSALQELYGGSVERLLQQGCN